MKADEGERRSKPRVGQIVLRPCSQCGLEFIPAPLHIYKQDHRIFCSWSCLTRYRKEKEEPK